MDIAAIIVSQYGAALDMLEQTIARCPEALWDSPGELMEQLGARAGVDVGWAMGGEARDA